MENLRTGVVLRRVLWWQKSWKSILYLCFLYGDREEFLYYQSNVKFFEVNLEAFHCA